MRIMKREEEILVGGGGAVSMCNMEAEREEPDRESRRNGGRQLMKRMYEKKLWYTYTKRWNETLYPNLESKDLKVWTLVFVSSSLPCSGSFVTPGKWSPIIHVGKICSPVWHSAPYCRLKRMRFSKEGILMAHADHKELGKLVCSKRCHSPQSRDVSADTGTRNKNLANEELDQKPDSAWLPVTDYT